ncbi:double-strand break repair protein AddB [Elioraea sp.]|uniref:double-strand break repair protein AddB n=1 Tax=Elioraea sp. TaxID=2185103 RepID=UPI0021DDBC98|nr:double-strand break repair protein AddB [Elioraea sp.]GIX08886.1 MAG: double-strand break repair protein AddB [Elioraea sp.]
MRADALGAPPPRVFTIAPDRPFLDDLAVGLSGIAGEDPLALARITVLLPTRRAGRGLADAMLRLTGGRAALLPRIHPVGDLPDEALAMAGALAVPPAVAPLARRAALARLVGAFEPEIPLERAWRLAEELGALFDEMATEDVDPARLATLVPERFAAHWQRTLKFLEIVTAAWPRELRDRGASDPAERRVRLLRAQAESWRTAPPAAPVIAAGSTGSIPAVAELLGVVASLPQGAVVLPGLDQRLPEALWDRLPDTHPQAGLARLLRGLAIPREAVRPWPARAPAAPIPDRAALAAAIMAPPEGLEAWRERDPARWRASLAGLARVDAADPHEEAMVAALAVRRALETPGRTVAVVTPDRFLARRIATELGRFGVRADDSGGEPLANAPAGTFIRLLAAAVADDLAPVPLLALLKHPLAAAGEAPARFRLEARALERTALRGPRPAPGLDGIAAAIEAARRFPPRWADFDAATRCLARLRPILEPVLALAGERAADIGALLEAHLVAAERLAETPDRPGPLRLWAGEDGEALARHLAELASAVEGLPPVAPRQFPALLEPMLEGPVVRLRRVEAEHPRVAILGALEARLQHADLIVLAGLNEGTWPEAAEPGPWLSRPMREAMGLPSPERRIGQAAHDVAQLLCAGAEVLLTRSRRVEGAPTVPSRWLSRLDAFLRGQFGAEAAALLRPPEDFAAIARVLDDPGAPMPEQRPAPRPPLAARPRRLSVTEIATWIADPYALYARRVLGIEPLEPLDAEADAGDFGDIVHGGIAEVLRATGLAWPEPAEAARLLEAAFRRRLDRSAARPAQAVLWRPRLARIAAFVAATEAQRRAGGPLGGLFAEVKTEHAIGGLPGGPFLLVAKADRIEHRDGRLAVLDYKTGAVPTDKQVKAGTQPQLTLEAALAARGAFAGIPALPPGELAYWHLSGGFVPGSVHPRCAGEEAAASETAWAGLLRRLHAFDDPATPYMARPHPRLELYRSPYAVLARIDEWSAGLDRE